MNSRQKDEGLRFFIFLFYRQMKDVDKSGLCAGGNSVRRETMQYIGSGDEMQRIDAYSIETMGIPGIVLMERAALAMEEEIVRRFPAPASVTIIAERGNNGGDGLALGRLLLAIGYDVGIFEIGGVRRASESYQIQRKILENLGVCFLEALPETDSDLWVDAVFGVGLKREVAGIQREVLEEVNRRNGYKIAVDIPSGVDASSGRILGYGFQADMTITFGLNKVGLALYPGASLAGEVVVKDIGFPIQAVDAVSPETVTYTREDLCRLPKRHPWSNKGTYGKVLLIVGAKNMAGAACLSAAAAYRTGSGLVRIFTCEENREILQSLVPEAIMTTYRTEEEALEKLPEALAWASVVGIGPGLGQNALTGRLLSAVLAQGCCPLVIDADGINTLAALQKEEREIYHSYGAPMILTPHLKEMERLTGRTVADIKDDLMGTAKEAADQRHIFVLKDARTIVSDGSAPTYINMSGNNGMSTGGSGDVLTGIICGLLAGGLSALEAARLGVYCHGLAGDEAAREKGYYGLMAGDLIRHLNAVIR